MVRVGGFGKWESEFQEGSMILITQNVGFIYKNSTNDFIFCIYKNNHMQICLLFLRVEKKYYYIEFFILYIYELGEVNAHGLCASATNKQ